MYSSGAGGLVHRFVGGNVYIGEAGGDLTLGVNGDVDCTGVVKCNDFECDDASAGGGFYLITNVYRGGAGGGITIDIRKFTFYNGLLSAVGDTENRYITFNTGD